MKGNIPFVILKRKNLPKEKLPTGIIFKCNEKGQMTEELMVEWLREVWHRRPGALLKKRGMLVLDAFKGRLTEKVKTVASNLLNTDQVIILGALSCRLQVLDEVFTKHSKIDYVACMGNGFFLGTVH
jgi:hypothetical protein